MNDVNLKEQTNEVIEQLLEKPQNLDIQTTHTHLPGLYLREMTVPSGLAVVGQYHKTHHVNILMKGKVQLFNDDGTETILEAPYQYVAPPGSKKAVFLEDTVWLNVHLTTLTNVDEIEKEIYEPYPEHVAFKEKQFLIDHQNREEDRQDFLAAISELGFTPEQVRAISEDESRDIPLPPGKYRCALGVSPIEGKGVFASSRLASGTVVGPVRIDQQRTPLGRYLNHAKTPNCRAFIFGDKHIVWLRTLREIAPNEELTTDYRYSIQLNREIERM